MKPLRKYQQDARYWCNRQLNQGNNPLIVGPTGTGKTLTGVNIISDRISLKEKNILLVPQLEIMDEWLKEFSNHDMNYGYINDEGVIGRNKDVYVCMFQSLSGMLNQLPEKFIRSFQNVFSDEAHRVAAESYDNIHDAFSHCRRGGWTATPYRLDNKPLSPIYDKMYESIKMSEAIEKKYLCKPLIIIPDDYKDYIPTQENYFQIDKSEQRAIIKDKKIIGDMLKYYKDVFNGLPVIVPCSGYEHAKLVTEMYESAGWRVGHLHSKLNKHQRRGIINDVKKKKINILCTVGVGVEGMNIHGLYGIIWLRFTESLTIYMQFNGRAMRPDLENGKDKFIMIDPVGNSVIHGRPDIDRKWSLETDYIPGEDILEAPTMKICPVCDTANSAENEKCWICHYDFQTGLLNGEPVDKRKRKLPRFIDGELVWLENDEVKNDKENNNTTNADLSDNISNQSAVSEITHAQKLEILKRDLTGLKNKTKFREGVKWL